MDQLLDSDDFGPMMQAEFFQQDANHANELETLKQKVSELMETKRIAEAEFSQQRGKFMEIFKQKEDELRLTREQLNSVRSQCFDRDSEISGLQKRVQGLSAEISDIKTSAAIAEVDRTDEMEKIQRKYQDDLASLQSIIKELTFQSDQSLNTRYEHDIAKLMRQKERLELELQETKTKLHRDRDGILTSLTKTLQKRVGAVDPKDSDEENLEYSMKRAQEDAEKLRTLITPFEDEISSLKSQLKHCQEHISLLESEEFKKLIEASKRHYSPSSHSTPNNLATDSTDGVSTASITADINENSAHLEGVKFIEQREWDALQKRLELTSKRTRRPCDACDKRLAEIKSLQDTERQMSDRLSALEHLYENEKQTRLQLEKYKESLETNLNVAAVEARTQLSALTTRVAESERFLERTKKQFSESKKQLKEQMNAMASYRDDLQAELNRLQDENEELIGKRSRFAQEIQEEFINFPNNMEEMRGMLSTYRDELIAAKVGKEHAESVLQRELESVRAQVVQQATKERSLSLEINQLREELAIRNSLYSDLEQHVRDSEAVKTVSMLQIEISNCKMEKDNADRLVQQLQSRVDSLKKDLINSEAIQKDFVQFSQSLQIELDKVRLGEREVRWQHPDDVSDCESCRRSLKTDPSEKDNCCHCGHVFCRSCLSQSLPSGPNHRPVPVCRSCYQGLVKVQASATKSDIDNFKDC